MSYLLKPETPGGGAALWEARKKVPCLLTTESFLGALTWPASWSNLKMAIQRPSVKYTGR